MTTPRDSLSPLPPYPLLPAEPAQPAAEQPALQPTAWQRFPSTRDLVFTLLAITALAAFLRFFRLSYQCYWTDESYTVRRIHGNFQQMLAYLSDQGFPPGWYSLLRWWTLMVEYFVSPGHWWSGMLGHAADPNFTALVPASTRSLTALCGTLTVPAMYLLARQFTDRKGALLVALLTAVNPYLIYYSRDIKMYQPMWLFAILNVALFFKWQTTHKHLTWFPVYVLTGFAMTAMHSTAWFLIALQLLFLLTRPRLKSLDGPLWALAAALMALLPIYWYANGTQWWDRVSERSGDTGLSWILDYTDMSWKVIASLPCSHLLGYLWPSYPPDPHVRSWFHLGNSDFDTHAATRALPWLANWETWVALVFAAILILGLFPWRGLRRSSERQSAVTQYRSWWLALWIGLPTLALAATWIPKESPWYKTVWHNLDHISPLWEPRYLGIILPAFILWLAASLRRLPTWPLRTVAVLFVLTASVASACSNYFIYRNPPFHEAADIAAKYYNPDAKKTLAVGHLNLTNPGVVIPVTYALARHVRPYTNGDYFLPDSPSQYDAILPENLKFLRRHSESNFQTDLYDLSQALNFLRRARVNPDIQTIVLTDKLGDLTSPSDPLSNNSLAEKLGPRWTLAEEKTYLLYFEWRFYIYNTWRTRVWKRQPWPELAPPAATTSRPAATTSQPAK